MAVQSSSLGLLKRTAGAARGQVSETTPGPRLGVGGLDQHRLGPGGAQHHAGVLEHAPREGEIVGASGSHSAIASHASGHASCLVDDSR
jgi:hypothetical protein